LKELKKEADALKEIRNFAGSENFGKLVFEKVSFQNFYDPPSFLSCLFFF